MYDKNGEIPSKIFANLLVNNRRKLKLQLDTGATCNVIPLKTLSEIEGNNINFMKSKAILKFYGGHTINSKGKIFLKCTRNNVDY